MSFRIVSALGVGFALGLKHALDADHLAAVAAMIGDRRRTLFGASLVGVTWGAGHAASLTAVALAVVLLGVQVPKGIAAAMEFAVGAMLVALGGRLLWNFRRGAVLHAHSHAHGHGEHYHLHVHAPGAEPVAPIHHALPAAAGRIAGGYASPLRPFLVGLVHGIAGSGALMLLVLAAMPSASARLAYVLLFALGSIAGMGCMSALAGLPFVLGGPLGGRAQSGMRLAAGAISLVIGLGMMWGFSPDL
jgi:high-affinity nickel-transport protein